MVAQQKRGGFTALTRTENGDFFVGVRHI